MDQMKIIIFSMMVCVVVFTSSLWSGTTGKIAGTVKDKTTGESQPGVNVIVLGTSLGTVTDLNGDYTILQVAPGTYKVQISFIWYKKIIVDNVRVFIDQTARVDVTLEQEAIQV